MFSKLIILAGVAFAQPSQTPDAAQPYIVARASDAAINYAVRNRQSGVDESVARSAAVEIVNSAIAPPQVTQLIMSAASYYAANGPTVAGTQAQNLASQASNYYDAIATAPAYQNFASLVHNNAKLFDVNGMINSAQNAVVNQGKAHNKGANLIVSQATGSYNSLKADPAGAKAVETAQSLGRKIGSDFKLNTISNKARYQKIKSSLKNMLAGN